MTQAACLKRRTFELITQHEITIQRSFFANYMCNSVKPQEMLGRRCNGQKEKSLFVMT